MVGFILDLDKFEWWEHIGKHVRQNQLVGECQRALHLFLLLLADSDLDQPGVKREA